MIIFPLIILVAAVVVSAAVSFSHTVTDVAFVTSADVAVGCVDIAVVISVIAAVVVTAAVTAAVSAVVAGSISAVDDIYIFFDRSLLRKSQH